MSASFKLKFDKTNPSLNIYFPSYSSSHHVENIVIQANEKLAMVQDIYIIDSNGTRFNYTLTLDNDRYYGSIDLGDISVGVANIYATLKDEVLNSTTISKSFTIISVSTISVILNEFIQGLINNESINTMYTKEESNYAVGIELTCDFIQEENVVIGITKESIMNLRKSEVEIHG